MKESLIEIFLTHWQRKAIAMFIAAIVWFSVDQSLTVTKTIDNIAVRVIHLSSQMTLENGQSDGLLNRRISLTFTGNKTFLEELSSQDFEVAIDPPENEMEWSPKITKKQLLPLHKDVDLNKGISRINYKEFIVKLTKLMRDKISVIITKPIGEPPKGYQYIDIWPYQLSASVVGPEEVVTYYKAHGIKKTFNLNEISKEQLDTLQSTSRENGSDEVSFFIPESWKKIEIPSLSDAPLMIDDGESKQLRIDFIRSDLHPIQAAIPISLFYPPKHIELLNPNSLSLSPNTLIKAIDGAFFVDRPLLAKNVSKQFIDVVEHMLQITIIAAPKTETKYLPWSVQLIHPRLLEDRYVAIRMADFSSEERSSSQPKLREEYLRNLFRNYMHRLQLCTAGGSPLHFEAEIHKDRIFLSERKNPGSHLHK